MSIMANNNTDGKQYGLILPKKTQLSVPKAGNVFGNNSDSDGEEGTDWVRKALKAENKRNTVKKQVQLSMEKALKENPTIYQYDEVYDEMERTKVEGKATTVEKKKPKYIENLLKAAERRKREQEHRIERMVHKEREAEGAMYADKESFVTSAYRAKLEEFKKMEEEESRMDRLEAIGDVTKQQDISGFYRHLYHQTIETDKTDVTKEKEITKEVNTSEPEDTKSTENKQIRSHSPTNELINENKIETTPEANKKLKAKKTRHYRKRVHEENESDSDHNENTDVNNAMPDKKDDINHSPSKYQTDDSLNKKTKLSSTNDAAVIFEDNQEAPDNNKITVDSNCLKNLEINIDEEKENNEKTPNSTNKEEQKVKVSIWEKRTVGPIFEAALERYHIRKTLKLGQTLLLLNQRGSH
ncbi:nuclear speckle splicing regulatory protein 1 [Orussus abietinus]|uniref:nuclear speckle splicing regulatory protein 1 n=1 Tax=Orussus abietinus TaxID=222816 RepID=UPI00062613CF|nr:nuclear speckle splicing regulatory protein 1 [Orussus abietinus]